MDKDKAQSALFVIKVGQKVLQEFEEHCSNNKTKDINTIRGMKWKKK